MTLCDFRTPKLQRLKEQIEQADKLHNTLGKQILYLASRRDSSHPMPRSWAMRPHEGRKRPWARVIVEKRSPCLESAKQPTRN